MYVQQVDYLHFSKKQFVRNSKGKYFTTDILIIDIYPISNVLENENNTRYECIIYINVTQNLRTIDIAQTIHVVCA